MHFLQILLKLINNDLWKIKNWNQLKEWKKDEERKKENLIIKTAIGKKQDIRTITKTLCINKKRKRKENSSTYNVEEKKRKKIE